MKKKNEIPFWAKLGHSKPVSRRDFLATGIIPFTAGLILPGWYDMILAPAAHASEAGCASGSGLPALMIVNLSGGSAMTANFVPMLADGSMLPSYSKMGMGQSPEIVRDFNNVPFYSGGTFLQGLQSALAAETSQTVRNNTSFVGLCVRSRDDSAENPFAIEGLASRAGLVGNIMPNLQRMAGGYNHKYAGISPPAPLTVNAVNDIANSLGYAGALKNSLNQGQKQSLARLISNLSSTQSRRLASNSSGAQVAEIVRCAGIKNIDLNQGSFTGVSLNENTSEATAIRGAWGINANQNNNMSIFANVTYNVLKGNAGSGTISLGGYDYHDQTRTTGDARDREAGVIIGRILRTAELLGKPIFIYVTSDGSVVSQDSASGGTVWTSDRGDAGALYMLAYDPKGRHETSAIQLGNFVAGQAADASHLIGNTPELAASAVFANYMSFAGRLGEFGAVAPGRFNSSQLDAVVKIAG